MSLLHRSKGPVRVVGITESNKNVTIDQASPSQGGLSFGPQSGTHRRSFISDKVIIGQLYDEASPIELRRVAFEIEGAFEWFGRSGFAREGSSAADLPNVAFRYEAPTPINFQVDQEINGQVFFGIENMSTPAPWSQEWSIVQLCSIVLTKSGAPWTFADINLLRLFVQSFCSLVTGYPGSIVKQSVFVEKDNGPDAKGYRPLSYPYRDYDSKFELPENVHPHQMAMSFAGLEASFEGVLERWWQYCRENEPAVRQVMVSRFGELAISDHFVALTKALEASVGKDLGQKVHFVKVAEHLATLLASEMDGALDVVAFSEAVRDYRNWFTHFDRNSRVKSVDYSERSLTRHDRLIYAVLPQEWCMRTLFITIGGPLD